MGHTEEVHYTAFISYRHRPLDSQAAKRIQRSIESYTVPKGLRKEPGMKKLGRVFRDEDELPISSSLSDSITYALDHTDFLIVICTPDLPLSRWCEQEIRYFIQTHDRDHVIAVLADGTPDTSFSPLMLNTFDEAGNFLEPVEPLAANIGGRDHTIDNKMYRKEIYRIYAALLDCRFDELWQREKRARARRMSIAFGAAAALMAAFSVFLISKNATIQRQNEMISEQNDELVAFNATIQKQNEEINSKNDELTANMSSVQTDLGLSLLTENFLTRARECGIRAIEDAGALYDRRAETLLANTLAAYRYEKIMSDVILENGDSIADLELAENGELAVMLDHAGEVFCIELASSAELWRLAMPEPEIYTGGLPVVTLGPFKIYSEIFPAAGGELIVYKDYAKVVALSARSGEEVWRYEYAYNTDYWGDMDANLMQNSFRAISDDGSLIALLDKLEKDQAGVHLLVFDALTGEERGRILLEHEQDKFIETWYMQGGAFTEDHSAIAVALAAEEGYAYFAVDLASMSLLDAYSYPEAHHSIVYGLSYDRESGDLFCAQLQPRRGGIATSLFHRDGTTESKLTYHTISSDIGKYMDTSVYDNLIQPMLVCGDTAVVCSDEVMLLFDRKTNTLNNSCDVSGRILDSTWVDDGDPVVYLLTASGSVLTYRLGTDHIQTASYEPSDVSDLTLGRFNSSGSSSGDQPLQFVSVPAANNTRLLSSRLLSDPTLEYADMEVPLDTAYMASILFSLSPSHNRLFAFIPNKESDGERRFLVRCLDAATLKVLSSLTIDTDYSAESPVAIDDDRFFYAGTVWSMDGSTETLPQGSASNLEDLKLSCLVLSDGRILVYEYEERYSSVGHYMPPYCWIDGELVSDPKTSDAFSLKLYSTYWAGRNGLILCLGSSVADDTVLENKEKTIVAYNVGSGKLSYVRDEALDSEAEPIMAVGTQEPVFACAYTGNSVTLYDTETGEAQSVEGAFQEGEIQQLCFSRGDKYLLALTGSGVLYCIDTQTGSLVWSGKVFADSSRLRYLDSIDCFVLENGRLCFCGLWNIDDMAFAVIDLDYDLIISNISKVRAVFPEIGRGFYTFTDNNNIMAFEFHSMDDLLAFAKESLGQ